MGDAQCPSELDNGGGRNVLGLGAGTGDKRKTPTDTATV